MPIFFLTNITHFVVFKHCLQMHIVFRKYGPVAAGIIGALYRGAVQTDGGLRYRCV